MNTKNTILNMAIKYTNTESVKKSDDVDLISDFGYDSLSFIQLINDLENHFNIEIDLLEIDLKNIHKLNVLVKYIEEKTK